VKIPYTTPAIHLDNCPYYIGHPVLASVAMVVTNVFQIAKIFRKIEYPKNQEVI
jgi:hypothetical protein